MEGHPHNNPASFDVYELPADEIPDKLTLPTRAIAGVMILLGTLQVVEVLLYLVFDGGNVIGPGVALLPIGWCLLLGREWARGWAVIVLSFLTVASGVLLLASIFTNIDNLHIHPNFREVVGTTRRILVGSASVVVLAACFSAVRYLTTPHMRAYYHISAEDASPVAWNPLKWRFGVGTLMFVTVLVAFAAVQVASNPMFRQWWLVTRAHPRSMPAYLNTLPPMPTGDSTVTSSASTTERKHGLSYGYITPPFGRRIPHLQYAYFVSKPEDGVSLKLPSLSKSYSGGPRYSLQLEGHPTQEFPGAVQLVEVHDGRLKQSDMHITFPEFWSYLHSDKPRTLTALENHVKELRRSEGARD